MRLKRILASFSLMFCVAAHAKAQNGSHSDQRSLTIFSENGLLSVSIYNHNLQEVCKVLEREARVRIILSEQVANDRISREVRAAQKGVALQELFAGYDIALLYSSAANGESEVRTVWILPSGGGADLKPARQTECAGTRELEAMVEDTNPAVREAAYQQLLERSDPRGHGIVVDAIRGTRERDQELRANLLVTAMKKGGLVTAAMLMELLKTDTSERIRWIALDALREHASAEEAAEAASTDPSEAVRSRALSIRSRIGLRAASNAQSSSNQDNDPE